MSELLDKITNNIATTLSKIQTAESAGASEAYLISLQNTLAAQQNEKNILLGQSTLTPGNPPSNKFLFELELVFLCYLPCSY